MKQRLSGSMEDYLEAILILKGKKPRVRVKHIAEFLSVTRPSVVSAVSVLEEKGYVEHERYGDVQLTQVGEERAREIYSRHIAIHRFLSQVLALDQEIAERDACRLEHQLHPTSVERMESFLEFIEANPDRIADWVESIRNGKK